MKNIVWILICACCSVKSQHTTVGLLRNDSIKTFKGYNLLYPEGQPNVYLIDNNGRIVHVWTDSQDARPGNTVHLLKDGSILKTRKLVNDNGPIQASGVGGTVEKRDWNNNLVWTFTLNDSFNRLHHDIEPLPNGNILMLCLERKTTAEAIAKGRNPAYLTEGELWSDKIIEVRPIGKDSFSVIWEWRAWDHLVQSYDSLKPKFGQPSSYPGKIDINYAHGGGVKNWLFFNAISYNIALDQVVVSYPGFNEIWIIDHTTTTEQAAVDYGGYSTKGGELMFRWGNPAAYGWGTASDQKLFYPSDIQWIGKNWQEKGFGKLSVFNNRVGPGFSTAHMIFPTIDTYFWEYQKVTNTQNYLPRTFEWTYQRPDTASMYSSESSSVQFLPNDNVLICVAELGYSFEVTPDNEIVWEYKTPLKAGARIRQGEVLKAKDNVTPQMNRYAENYPAFSGKVLQPSGVLELPADTNSGLGYKIGYENLSISPNPASSVINIQNDAEPIHSVVVYAVTGQIVAEYSSAGTRNMQVDVSCLPQGLYILSINGNQVVKMIQVGD